MIEGLKHTTSGTVMRHTPIMGTEKYQGVPLFNYRNADIDFSYNGHCKFYVVEFLLEELQQFNGLDVEYSKEGVVMILDDMRDLIEEYNIEQLVFMTKVESKE